MPYSDKRDRGALVALAVILLSVVLVAWAVAFQNVTNAEKTSSDDAQPQNRSEQYVTNSPSGGDDFNPWHDPIPQWGMFGLSAVAAGISIWAIIWVKRTWNETKRTAEAAIEANRIAATGQRAWMAIEGINVGQRCLITEDEVRIEVQVAVKNYGDSPAFKVGLTMFPDIRAGAFDPQDVVDRALLMVLPAKDFAIFPGQLHRFGRGTAVINRREFLEAQARCRPPQQASIHLPVTVTYAVQGDSNRKHTGKSLYLTIPLLESGGIGQSSVVASDWSPVPEWIT